MNVAAQPPTGVSESPPRASGNRLVYLDALRGLFLVLMAINHIPSDLQAVTDHPLGFVSAAEGFVFLAGLMAGLVYTRKLDKAGVPAICETSFKRAFSIYRYHITAFLVVFAWVLGYRALLGGPPPGTPDQLANFSWRTLIMAPLLLAQPSLFDILPMYCGFILLIPFLVRAFEAGKRSFVLISSFALWALTNAFCPQAPLSNAWLQTGVFNICAWQILFVFGMAFGHSWARKQAVVPAPRAVGILLVASAGAVLFAMRHAFLPPLYSVEELGWLTNKNNLAPLRLIDTAILGYLIHLMVTRYPRVASWRALAFLGKSSLAVFAVHVVVASGIHSFPNVFAQSSGGRWLGTAVMMLALYATATFHQKAFGTFVRYVASLFTRKPALVSPEESNDPRALGPANSVHR